MGTDQATEQVQKTVIRVYPQQGRITGWRVSCAEHGHHGHEGDILLFRTKKFAISMAQLHARESHLSGESLIKVRSGS